MTHEQKFLQALKDVFIGAPVEGESGYINLMRIKARYFEQGIAPRLLADVRAALAPFPTFHEELFDKLYSFFHRYFSESGSIYFRYTPLHQNVYARVYTDDRDVMLFWKTHMLYYVKTDRLFQNMEVKVDNFTFYFDVSELQHKQANEKRALVFDFAEKRADGTLVFTVTYSERGRKTKMNDIQKALRAANTEPREEVLERAFRLFERQSEVDYFINKDARAFLREQFDLWMYQYVFSETGTWTVIRVQQLQVLRDIAYKLIDFIAQFEDELVKVWNKPKFVRGSHYVITLDRIAAAEQGDAVLRQVLTHPGITAQLVEWHELGMVDDAFTPEAVWQRDLFGQRLDDAYQYLPLDTRHFPDMELGILKLFDDLDKALDGWLVWSENYQALRTLESKFVGQVKCIYIDPPYNTGSDEFIYNDRFQYASWLTMAENRLQLARRYLNQSGIFISSIGREQVFEFELLLDYIFGSSNQLGDLIWEKGRKNDSRYFSLGHDYLLVYADDKGYLDSLNTVWREEKPGARVILKEYQRLKHIHGNDYQAIETGIRQFYGLLPKKHPALRHRRYNRVDANGLWRDDNISWPGGNGPRYDVIHPVTQLPCKVPDGGWRFASLRKFRLYDEHGFIEYRSDHSEPPILKRYLNYVSTEFDPDSRRGRNVIVHRGQEANVQVMPSVFYKNQQPTVMELRDVLGEQEAFKNPKDPEVIGRLVEYTGDSTSLILDFFAGSGTTAHAVMNLNREDGGRRKYILVEMGNHFETVILPRVKKVAFSDKWKDGQAQPGGQGLSHFVKVYSLEQYEDALRLARYEDADLFHNPYADPYSSYVFLRDLKMLEAVDVDTEAETVAVHLDRLYPDIDLAETLSCVTGKPIKRITAEAVEFRDGTRADLVNPDWELVKPLIWW